MAMFPDDPAKRYGEAERLIGLARAMLNEPAEQLAVDYLDHAAAALRYLSLPMISAVDKAPERDRG